MQTHIGYGSPNQQDTAAAHGSPLGEEEVLRTKRNLGWPEDKTFFVPDAVRDHMRSAVTRGAEAQDEWTDRFAAYKDAHPEKARAFTAAMDGALPRDWTDALPTFDAGPSMATRASSGKTLDAIGPHLPALIGGSADLTGSNKTDIEGVRTSRRIIRRAVLPLRRARARHGGRGQRHGAPRRRAAVRRHVPHLQRLPAALAPPQRAHGAARHLRAHARLDRARRRWPHAPAHRTPDGAAGDPELTVIRPADANEAAQAWRAALNNEHGPTVLVLTRQGLPTLDRSVYAPADGLQRGAYVLSDDDGTPDAILMASGSEVQHIVAAGRDAAER